MDGPGATTGTWLVESGDVTLMVGVDTAVHGMAGPLLWPAVAGGLLLSTVTPFAAPIFRFIAGPR